MRKLLIIILALLLYDINAQLIPCRAGRFWGYCDTGKIVKIRTEFDFADFFTGDIGFVRKDSAFRAINTKGEFITPPLKHYGSFADGLCPVQLTDGHCYYINTKGEIVIDRGFSAAENFSEGLAIVSVHKKLGIINTKGDWVRFPDFDTSSVYFKSGFLMGLSKGRYFYINKYGRELALPDSIKPGSIFSEGMAAVYVTKTKYSNGKPEKITCLEFMDTSGKIALQHFINDSFDYSEYIMLEKEFMDGKAIIKTRNEIGWDYYYIDKKKRFSPIYSTAKHLGSNYYLGVIGYYMAEVRILDSNYYVAGQFQHKPLQVGEFGNGLLPFCDKNRKWGYIDSNCREVIPAKYDAALTFKNGYAFVRLNGYEGVIDTKGREFFQ